MVANRYITLAIHTFHRANSLKEVLEAEGIDVLLQNVDLENPKSAAGVRVRIKESDLPFALRIVENPEIFAVPINSQFGRIVLVPIDFGELSRAACRTAFRYAFKNHCSVHLLHAYNEPTNAIQLSDALTYDGSESPERKLSRIEAARSMERFCEELKNSVKTGELPPVAFTFDVLEGLPEDVIVQISKSKNPHLVVMATRGADTKERELIGSVTAEVLDTLRYPIFTVPPTQKSTPAGIEESSGIESIKTVMLFVNFDQEDILALDALHRFLPSTPDLKIVFVKIEKKLPAFNAQNYHNLLSYAEKHYPECHFSVSTQTVDGLLTEFTNWKDAGTLPDLIVVPNKKKNAFARLFNPGMAHRLLFHADVPMMVVPV